MMELFTNEWEYLVNGNVVIVMNTEPDGIIFTHE